MAKHINENDVFGPVVSTSASQWVNEINDGTLTHAVAVKNGITFFNGSADTTGAKWDGIQEFEVVIPTLADIVSNPVTFKGVIDGTHPAPSKPSGGDLYYIGEDGTYFNEVCEAGDMAIYDGSAWHVISGENQTSIYGVDASTGVATFELTETAASVLNVEGKDLKLAVNFAGVSSHLSITKNADATIALADSSVTVPGMSIALSKAADTTLPDITEDVSISLPTALASGAVTITDKVLVDDDFVFDSGAFPTISKNAAAIVVDASHSMTIGKANNSDGATGDYLTSVVAIKGVSFTAGTEASHQLRYMTGLSAAAGTEFMTGMHAWTSADGENPADLLIPGAVTAPSVGNTFATGWNDEGASGEVLSSITVGAVSANTTGSDFLRGLSAGGKAVVTSVTMGSAVQDTAASWFYSGLGNGSDVVTDVTVGTVTLVADGSAGANAVVSASVSGHVLSFNTSKFMTPVAISQADTTVSKKGFTKTGVKLQGFDSASDTFLSGGITQAATSVSYKSLSTAAVSLSQDAASKYYFNKAADHAYSAVMGYSNLSTTDATYTKNSPKLENTAITATIPADSVAVGLNAGTLPTLTIKTATGTISGSVGTTLSTSNVSWKGVDATKAGAVTIPGAYSLVSDSSAAGAITVASAGTYNATGNVTIAADEFVKDVNWVK